jgi:hypothetical protein
MKTASGRWNVIHWETGLRNQKSVWSYVNRHEAMEKALSCLDGPQWGRPHAPTDDETQDLGPELDLVYDTKCGRYQIIKVIMDPDSIPVETQYRMYEFDSKGRKTILPGLYRPKRITKRSPAEQYSGCWRLSDAKRSIHCYHVGMERPNPGKRPRVQRYKTYDPEAEGYGNEEQWQATFNARMTQDEIDDVLDGYDPYVVLGFDIGQPLGSKSVLRKAYRKRCHEWHPDKHPESRKDEATAEMRLIRASYEHLCTLNGWDT